MALILLALVVWMCWRTVAPWPESRAWGAGEAEAASLWEVAILLLIPMVRVLMGEAVGESRLPSVCQGARLSFQSLP